MRNKSNTDNGKFGRLGNKIKFKTVLDRLAILVIIALVICANLLNKLGNYDAIFISGIVIVYLFQYEITRKWVEKSIFQSVDAQSSDTIDTAYKITEISDKQKDGIEGYIKLAHEISSATGDLQEEIKFSQQKIKNVSGKVDLSLEFSQREQQTVKANIEKMLTLRQKIQIIAGLILELSERTQQIGETIEVVEDIAEQTNMLALNAAVEAARAGENGKGFSVVAGEIRKLADESKQATTKITALIKDIQQATNSTVMATEEGSKEIESGVKLADDININIESLIKLIGETKLFAEEIYSDYHKQTEDSEKVSLIISELKDGLSSSLELIKEEKENIKVLDEISGAFKQNLE